MKSIVLSIACAAALAACNRNPGRSYPDCDVPVAIAVTNEDVIDGDPYTLALPKAVETGLGIQVTDAEGDLCDPAELELTLDGSHEIRIVDHDEDVILMADADAIDLGSEPTAVLHASVGDVHVTWDVAGVVSLGGTWDVLITEATRFPQGYPIDGVLFTQRGRRMIWEDCTISLVCERDAIVLGATFTVEAPDVGLTIAVPIDPDRNRFAGPWSTDDGEYMGEFSAVRVE